MMVLLGVMINSLLPRTSLGRLPRAGLKVGLWGQVLELPSGFLTVRQQVTTALKGVSQGPGSSVVNGLKVGLAK
jgi:hypothetical protein